MNSGNYCNSSAGISLNVNIGQLEVGKLLVRKNVLITGGAKGIGLEIAKKCIAQGANVIITGRDVDSLNNAARDLGDKCFPIVCDMNKISEFDSILIEATNRVGLIDCIVNNAGISLHEGDFLNVTEATWDNQIDTNLKGTYFFTQSWLRYYRLNNMKSGKVVMMASDTSGMGSSIPYGISKAGIASLTIGLAKMLITEGIRVNAVAPGTTLTEMTECFVKGEICRDSTQGKRVLFPEEIAETVIFLLSDLSACISGNIIGCSEANICFNNIERELETNP